MNTIIRASGGELAPVLWIWGKTADSFRADVHRLPVIAWSVEPDGSSLPITPMGKFEHGGAWAVTSGTGCFITSTGELATEQSSIRAWLEQRSKS